ncbi:hypothetical protein FHU33_0745 [Blastococcus colisei]|uniref:AMIN-like domain-containing protein n=1 Tax=Blastococcus colisei TaxID=1564162 RepID=A0A543PBC0_9ACTN|nr:hypothetical protein [Blastococcus colisei]TQN41377.1 hypothetical protein FHU33_0745 [Blastococcus colisei]
MRRPRVTVLVFAVLLVAACTDEVHGVASPGGPASSSTSPPSGGSPTPSAPQAPTDEQAPDDASFPADTEDDSGPAQPGTGDPAGAMHVDGLRFRSHDGYTRLVVDLNTNGVPEWTVGYSEPTGPGGGPVDIAGEAFLRVQLRTGAAPGGQSTSRIRTSPGPVVEALTTGFFEGYEEILLGIDGGQQPFRAFALTDPGRIVIDVRYG